MRSQNSFITNLKNETIFGNRYRTLEKRNKYIAQSERKTVALSPDQFCLVVLLHILFLRHICVIIEDKRKSEKVPWYFNWSTVCPRSSGLFFIVIVTLWNGSLLLGHIVPWYIWTSIFWTTGTPMLWRYMPPILWNKKIFFYYQN